MTLNSPAFALLRPMFETYVRGEWLGRQTVEEVNVFLDREQHPPIENYFAFLESTEDFDINFLF